MPSPAREATAAASASIALPAPSAAVEEHEAAKRATGGDVAECDHEARASWPYRSIDALGTSEVEAGGYRTSGWVIQCYTPPPCPRPRRCSPTPPPHLALAQSNDPLATRITLEGGCDSRFKLGEHYEVAVVLSSAEGLSFGGRNHGYYCPKRP